MPQGPRVAFKLNILSFNFLIYIYRKSHETSKRKNTTRKKKRGNVKTKWNAWMTSNAYTARTSSVTAIISPILTKQKQGNKQPEKKREKKFNNNNNNNISGPQLYFVYIQLLVKKSCFMNYRLQLNWCWGKACFSARSKVGFRKREEEEQPSPPVINKDQGGIFDTKNKHIHWRRKKNPFPPSISIFIHLLENKWPTESKWNPAGKLYASPVLTNLTTQIVW